MGAKRILIADPECGARSPLAQLLEARDYEVTRVGSIDEAWRALTTREPHLLLMEPMMPAGTEGFHLVWKLRDYPDAKLSKLPIIVLSRIHHTTRLNIFPNLHDGHYHAREFLPVQAFLDKPFEEKVLLEAIDGVVGQENS